MFSLPISAPFHGTLARHVFGRFLAQPAPASVLPLHGASVESAQDDASADDAPFDLAQRVREVGEW